MENPPRGHGALRQPTARAGLPPATEGCRGRQSHLRRCALDRRADELPVHNAQLTQQMAATVWELPTAAKNGRQLTTAAV